eukprot:COSAG06_NODE_37530_length_434_cov_0.889552_1_plen_63_part_01
MYAIDLQSQGENLAPGSDCRGAPAVRSHCEASAASLASDSVPARLPVQLADMLRATGRLQALH